jgi:hypothetical protein
MDVSFQNNADRISSIRAWAETLVVGLGDAGLMRQMEQKIQETGYWHRYRAEGGSTLPDRGAAALRVVPVWKG